MSPEFHLIYTSWQDNKAALGAIRRTVFIEEQQVPEALEYDGLDEACQHVLVTDAEKRPVGCGRIKADGHIGRMAVLKDCRGVPPFSRHYWMLQDNRADPWFTCTPRLLRFISMKNMALQ
jgi:hypothetical protein